MKCERWSVLWHLLMETFGASEVHTTGAKGGAAVGKFRG